MTVKELIAKLQDMVDRNGDSFGDLPVLVKGHMLEEPAKVGPVLSSYKVFNLWGLEPPKTHEGIIIK